MQRFILLVLVCLAAAFAQTDQRSITVTVSRDVTLPADLAVYNVTVAGNQDLTLDAAAGVLSDFGVTVSDVQSVNTGLILTGNPSSIPQTNYTFRLAVPYAKQKDTVSRLAALQTKLRTDKSTMSLGFGFQRVEANPSALDEARVNIMPDLVTDARNRARTIGSAAGLSVGKLRTVSDPMSFSSGTLTSSISITATFDAQ